ncbi:hypothetical protein Noda2021_12430 [Candidatus Dependentiae bacterium Noda2021]|nr:hypothetical protein Noda2021_12430 [Candidatus Dependentiae bacterium Noda2021]
MKILLCVGLLFSSLCLTMQKTPEITADQLPLLVNVLPVEIWARIIALKAERYGGLRYLKRNTQSHGAASEKLYSGPNQVGLKLNNLGYIRRGNDFAYQIKVVDGNNKSVLCEQLISNYNASTIVIGIHPIKNKFFILNNDNQITSYRVNPPDEFGLIGLKKKHVFAVKDTIPLAYHFMVYDLSQNRDNAFLTSLISSKDDDALLVRIQKVKEMVQACTLLTLGEIKNACHMVQADGDVAIKLTGLEFLLSQRSLFLVHAVLSKQATVENGTNTDQPLRKFTKTKTLMCIKNQDKCDVLDVFPGIVSWDQPEDFQRKNSYKDASKPHYLLALRDSIDCAFEFVDSYRKKYEDLIAVEKSKNFCLKGFNRTQLRKI